MRLPALALAPLALVSALASALAPAAVLSGCKDPPAVTNADAGPGKTGVEAGAPPVVKKLDADRCDAGAQELEAIARAAKKTCVAPIDCTEWVRKGNCGSVPVARPFPPPETEARWRSAKETVDVACPDEPRCRWASMGVECRGGLCVPSLEGAVEIPAPAPAPAPPQTQTP